MPVPEVKIVPVTDIAKTSVGLYSGAVYQEVDLFGERLYEFQGDDIKIDSVRERMARVSLGAVVLDRMPPEAVFLFQNGLRSSPVVPLRYIEALDQTAFRQRQSSLANAAAKGYMSFEDVLKEQALFSEGVRAIVANEAGEAQLEFNGRWVATVE